MYKVTEPGRKLIAPAMLLILLGMPSLLMAACTGDITRDGKVDGLDFAVLGTEMGRKDCFTRRCKSDLNNDGKVDGQDKKILQSEMGRRDCLTETIGSPESSGSGQDSKTVKAAPSGKRAKERNPAIWEKARISDEEQAEEASAEEIAAPTIEGSEPLEITGRKTPRNTRFIDHGDGTVTDQETGLMWTRDANLPSETLLFYEALAYIDEMNKGSLTNFGYTDWRLPTLEELRSLKDFTYYTGALRYALPEGHPFENMHWLAYEAYYEYPSYFWKPKLSWVNSFYCRIIGDNTFSCIGFLWPVRGGKKD